MPKSRRLIQQLADMPPTLSDLLSFAWRPLLEWRLFGSALVLVVVLELSLVVLFFRRRIANFSRRDRREFARILLFATFLECLCDGFAKPESYAESPLYVGDIMHSTVAERPSSHFGLSLPPSIPHSGDALASNARS